MVRVRTVQVFDGDQNPVDLAQNQCCRLGHNCAMFSLQSVRQATFLARWVLVWFVIAMGVAVASPLVQPQSYTLVCSTVGASKLVVSGEDGAPVMAHTLDCVACLPAMVPPPAVPHSAAAPGNLRYSFPAFDTAFMARRDALPAPARGPPAAARQS
jgi:hypothetical protein